MSPKIVKKKKNNFKGRVYDRCCNPLKLDTHHKTKGLSRVSSTIRNIYPHLSDQEFECTKCRQTIMKLRPTTNPRTPLAGRYTSF